MTKGQVKTSIFLACWVAAAMLLIVAGLGWEFYSITLHDQATISETVWVAFAAQPGPIMLLIVAFAGVVGYLGGHFFWQNKGTYDAIRKQEEKW